jgi:hypothetical protein
VISSDSNRWKNDPGSSTSSGSSGLTILGYNLVRFLASSFQSIFVDWSENGIRYPASAPLKYNAHNNVDVSRKVKIDVSLTDAICIFFKHFRVRRGRIFEFFRQNTIREERVRIKVLWGGSTITSLSASRKPDRRIGGSAAKEKTYEFKSESLDLFRISPCLHLFEELECLSVVINRSEP